MNSNFKKTALILSLSLLSVATLGFAVGTTIAGFERKKTLLDPTTSDSLLIAADGQRLSSYYLDIGIWGTIDNTGYSFWALVYVDNGGSDPTVLKYIKGTLDGSNYRYSIDRAKYDHVKFFRTASSNDSTLTSSTNYQHSYYTSTSPGTATDATGLLAFSAGNVTYQVTGWHGDYIDAVGFWR